jgi:hypothetical protein
MVDAGLLALTMVLFAGLGVVMTAASAQIAAALPLTGRSGKPPSRLREGAG